MSRKLVAIEKHIAQHRTAISGLEIERDKILSRSYIKCAFADCQKRSKISNLTYIQTHYYHPPHGCMGGDYWSESEGQWVCPKCGGLNRMMNFNKNETTVSKLKPYFGDIRNAHDR